MSKSPTRSRARHYATAFVGFIVSVVAICAAAPDAFAMRVVPPEGAGTTSTAVSHGGMAGWEIALIVIGAVLLISLLVGIVRRGRRAPVRVQTAS